MQFLRYILLLNLLFIIRDAACAADASSDNTLATPTTSLFRSDDNPSKEKSAEADKTLQKDKSESLAQKTEAASENVEQKVDELNKDSAQKRLHQKLSATAIYSPIDLLLPNKFGVNVGYLNRENKMYEAEFLRASVGVPFMNSEAGSLSDSRFSILVRKFRPESGFNWYWGVSYNSLACHIGPTYLNSVTPGNLVPGVDLVTIETLGLAIGIGHRWYIQNNFYFMIDWASWTQPFIILNKKDAYTSATSSTSDRDTFQRLESGLAYIPRISLLKLGLGGSF